MKLLLGCLLLIMFSAKSHAVVIFCAGDSDAFTDSHNLFVEEVDSEKSWRFPCQATRTIPAIEEGKITGFSDSKNIRMKIKGYGIGFRVSRSSAFMINCPTILKIDNLLKSPFYGVKAAAAVAVGVAAGVYSNKRGGVCILTSLEGLAIGAGVSGTKMTFY